MRASQLSDGGVIVMPECLSSLLSSVVIGKSILTYDYDDYDCFL